MNDVDIELIPAGTEVKVGDDIEAVVTAACIRDLDVTYECVWWDGRTRKSEWLPSWQIRVAQNTGALRVGFGTQSE